MIFKEFCLDSGFVIKLPVLNMSELFVMVMMINNYKRIYTYCWCNNSVCCVFHCSWNLVTTEYLVV